MSNKIENINEAWEELNDIVESYIREDDPISKERASTHIKELSEKIDIIDLDPEKILTGTVEEYNEDGMISYTDEYYEDSSYDEDTSSSY